MATCNLHSQVYSMEEWCSYCGKPELTVTGEIRSSLRGKERAISVVKLFETNPTITLEKVGAKFGLSREMVRLIYKQEKGVAWGSVKKVNVKTQLAAERASKLKQIKFNCEGCAKPVSYLEGSKRTKYCNECYHLRYVLRRKPTVLNTCTVCGESFHPFSNVGYQGGTGKFCSRKCYRKSDTWVNRRKLNPGEWSIKNNACLGCSTTKVAHYANGLCLSCYRKQRYTRK